MSRSRPGAEFVTQCCCADMADGPNIRPEAESITQCCCEAADEMSMLTAERAPAKDVESASGAAGQTALWPGKGSGRPYGVSSTRDAQPEVVNFSGAEKDCKDHILAELTEGLRQQQQHHMIQNTDGKIADEQTKNNSRYDQQFSAVAASLTQFERRLAQAAGPPTRRPPPRPPLAAAAAPATSTTATSVGGPPGAGMTLPPRPSSPAAAAAQAAVAKDSPPRPPHAAVGPAAGTTRSPEHSPRYLVGEADGLPPGVSAGQCHCEVS